MGQETNKYRKMMRTPSDGMRMQVRSSSMLLSRTTTEMKAEIIWLILRKFAENKPTEKMEKGILQVI